MDTGQRLADLLKQRFDNRLAVQLSEGLPTLLSSLRSMRTIPVKHLRSIYHVRAIINQRGRNLVQGFEELLSVLDAFEGQVVIHTLKEQEEICWVVFSDEAMMQFIGILRLPTQAGLVSPPDKMSD